MNMGGYDLDITTHFRIARSALKDREMSSMRESLSRGLVVAGTVMMDLSPWRFRHRHFYSLSRNYTYQKMYEVIDKLSEKETLCLTDWFTLGGILHYMMDYFCQVHQDESSYETLSHMRYERRLGKMLKQDETGIREYLDDAEFSFDVSAFELDDDIPSWVESLHEIYMEREDLMKKDLAFSIYMTEQIFMYVLEKERERTEVFSAA